MLMFQPLQRYADFEGRSRRSEYWLFQLFLVIAICIAAVIDQTVFGENAPILTALVLLGTFIPNLALFIRRLHDTNRSGWWYFFGLVPLIGGLVLFIFSVLDGTEGDNRFGPDPKGRNGVAAALA